MMMQGKYKPFFFIVAALLVFCGIIMIVPSCNQTYTPHPKGYFRIDLPEKKYKVYEATGCNYAFEIPEYAVVADYQNAAAEPCWKYIRFPKFNSEIFLSYKKVSGDLNVFIEDSRTYAYKHTVKAESINETVMHIPGKSYGVIYDIGGSAASSVQFYVTDSTNHFLRGALYFNIAPQPDSLAPVIEFLRKDIVKVMESVEWK